MFKNTMSGLTKKKQEEEEKNGCIQIIHLCPNQADFVY